MSHCAAGSWPEHQQRCNGHTVMRRSGQQQHQGATPAHNRSAAQRHAAPAVATLTHDMLNAPILSPTRGEECHGLPHHCAMTLPLQRCTPDGCANTRCEIPSTIAKREAHHCTVHECNSIAILHLTHLIDTQLQPAGFCETQAKPNHSQHLTMPMPARGGAHHTQYTQTAPHAALESVICGQRRDCRLAAAWGSPHSLGVSRA